MMVRPTCNTCNPPHAANTKEPKPWKYIKLKMGRIKSIAMTDHLYLLRLAYKKAMLNC